MVKKLYAVDENLVPIPGAVFTFTCLDGTILAAIDGGGSGSLSLDTNLHPELFDDEVHIRVTASGYETAGTDARIIPDAWQFIMPKKQNLLPVLGLGALLAAGAYQLSKKKSKKVSGFDFKTDALPYVVPAAIVIGGFIIYNKIFGDSPEDKSRQDALDKSIAEAGAPTMSDAELATAANQLKEDLTYSSVSNNTADAAHQLIKPNNTADVLRLIKAYGKHIITFFGIPTGSFTLEETVTRQMSADEIQEVNAYYSAMGINFKF